MELSSLVMRRVEPLFTHLDDELLALDPQAGLCFSLNVTAARVWQLIDDPTSLDAICRRLVNEFDVDDDTCLRGVAELVSELEAAGFVEVQRAGA